MITRLFKEALSTYSGNTITLYHYSTKDDDRLVLDPKKFGKNSWSRREKRSSATPKIFFYLDPEDKERFFSEETPLYSVEVPKSQVYDITVDPKGMIKKTKEQNQDVLNIDMLIENLKDAGFKGMYYQLKFDVVTWFYPITVERTHVYDTNVAS